jgi:hypothetical protein
MEVHSATIHDVDVPRGAGEGLATCDLRLDPIGRPEANQTQSDTLEPTHHVLIR